MSFELQRYVSMVNVSLRSIRINKDCPPRMAKAIYRRLAVTTKAEADTAQKRLNKVLAAVLGPDPMGDHHGRNE